MDRPGERMKEVILMIVEFMNEFHDLFISAFGLLGINMTDKEMHFWVLGIFGIIFFFATHIIFRLVSRWSITVISFIYTFTVLIVIVFAIEIQQKVTNRGHMEFQDAVQGLWGFLVLFSMYAAVKLIMFFIKNLFHKKGIKNKGKKKSRATRASRHHDV